MISLFYSFAHNDPWLSETLLPHFLVLLSLRAPKNEMEWSAAIFKSAYDHTLSSNQNRRLLRSPSIYAPMPQYSGCPGNDAMHLGYNWLYELENQSDSGHHLDGGWVNNRLAIHTIHSGYPAYRLTADQPTTAGDHLLTLHESRQR
jgi:hypothetical protein